MNCVQVAMNRFSLVFFLCSIFIALTCSPAFGGPKRFKIGFSIALTGPASTFGIDTQNILSFAFQQFGHFPIDIIVEDDRCSPKDAVTVAKKFSEIDKVDVVIGPVCTGAVVAAASIYERHRILHITPNARSQSLLDQTTWSLAANPGNVPPIEALLGFARRSSSKMAMLTEVTEYCSDVQRIAETTAALLKLDFESFGFESGDNDVRPVVIKALASTPGSIFINSQNESSFIKILRIAREQKFQGSIYGLYFPGGKSFITAAGRDADEIVYADFATPEEGSSVALKKIYNRFIEEKGELNSNASNFEYTYDLASAVVSALQSKVAPHDFMVSDKTWFTGVAGSQWRFDRRRRIDGRVVINRVASGKPEVVMQQIIK